MKAAKQPKILALGIVLSTLSIGGFLSSCTQGRSQSIQAIKIDGSSTVYPITDAVAKEFQKKQTTPIPIKVEFSGTGGGFKKFCTGAIDITNASRPIRLEEMAACNQRGIRYYELPIAFDALTVAINPQNDWARNITVAELKKIWEPRAQGKIKYWNQIRPEWPNRPINLYGAGENSGTFDYFTEAIMGTAKASRKDYKASEDDAELVKGVSQDPNALGYFGLAYYEGNKQQLKALPIDNGQGPVAPSVDTVQRSLYRPLARPLFIYVSFTSAQHKSEVRNFVQFYMENAPKIVADGHYIPLPQKGYPLIYRNFYNGKVGTVFAGQSRFDLTVEELLKQEAKF